MTSYTPEKKWFRKSILFTTGKQGHLFTAAGTVDVSRSRHWSHPLASPSVRSVSSVLKLVMVIRPITGTREIRWIRVYEWMGNGSALCWEKRWNAEDNKSVYWVNSEWKQGLCKYLYRLRVEVRYIENWGDVLLFLVFVSLIFFSCSLFFVLHFLLRSGWKESKDITIFFGVCWNPRKFYRLVKTSWKSLGKHSQWLSKYKHLNGTDSYWCWNNTKTV